MRAASSGLRDVSAALPVDAPTLKGDLQRNNRMKPLSRTAGEGGAGEASAVGRDRRDQELRRAGHHPRASDGLAALA